MSRRSLSSSASARRAVADRRRDVRGRRSRAAAHQRRPDRRPLRPVHPGRAGAQPARRRTTPARHAAPGRPGDGRARSGRPRARPGLRQNGLCQPRRARRSAGTRRREDRLRARAPEPVRSLAASTAVWMGATTKAVAVYDGAFWRDDGLAGCAVIHLGPRAARPQRPRGEPCCDLRVRRKRPVRAGHDDAARRRLRRAARRLFGPQAASPRQVHVVDWSRERSTSPTSPSARASTATYSHPRLQEPVLGRLHWASTETAPPMPATSREPSGPAPTPQTPSFGSSMQPPIRHRTRRTPDSATMSRSATCGQMRSSSAAPAKQQDRS
jgi:hypothetical protein